MSIAGLNLCQNDRLINTIVKGTGGPGEIERKNELKKVHGFF